ncbi:hypothetical protein [Streptomyces sp. NPDC049555]|uniref:hypothetical protein n=1 Tax=Streptomyces sp. NPDC049555 TaxID=3154930 RepID=UPI00342105C9
MYVHFEPVPPPRRSHAAYDVAEELRNHQGQWARIADYDSPNLASNYCHRIRHGKAAAFRPAGTFESMTRTGEDGRVYLWARYIGE